MMGSESLLRLLMVFDSFADSRRIGGYCLATPRLTRLGQLRPLEGVTVSPVPIGWGNWLVKSSKENDMRRLHT
jgi:hypothetical protein